MMGIGEYSFVLFISFYDFYEKYFENRTPQSVPAVLSAGRADDLLEVGGQVHLFEFNACLSTLHFTTEITNPDDSDDPGRRRRVARRLSRSARPRPVVDTDRILQIGANFFNTSARAGSVRVAGAGRPPVRRRLIIVWKGASALLTFRGANCRGRRARRRSGRPPVAFAFVPRYAMIFRRADDLRAGWRGAAGAGARAHGAVRRFDFRHGRHERT
ncbi:hypothetical protein EVAR_25272_1 [Eumeta japonica]|uniref:Uncharacterized protein n=1 Tax=Eumeta variegata TaxID=151549 RepID=A0A4C1VPF3_EUMVA|nr:hypothetical protein EVAR_25272_1 [Eumeta japonica]